MAHPYASGLQRSDLNRFLFADVGVEASGMTLTVLSALARRGIDPWQEAKRLAKMPRPDAAEGLAQTIAAMPASLWPLPAATAIATQLVALLPTYSSSSSSDAVRLTAAPSPLIRAKSLLPGHGPSSAHRTTSAVRTLWPRAIILALLGILLGGLVSNFFKGRDSGSPGNTTAYWSPPSSSPPATPMAHTRFGTSPRN